MSRMDYNPATKEMNRIYKTFSSIVMFVVTLLFAHIINAQSTCVINGHEYVDLGLPSGTLWATCNVGANNPEDNGDYFAWGETSTKNSYSLNTYQWYNGSKTNITKYNMKSDYGTVDDKKKLELSDDVANVNWGGSWRLPTLAEVRELKTNCTWTWTKMGEKNGYYVTGPNGNSIFLPTAGYKWENDISAPKSDGYYWSSSLAVSPTRAYSLFFKSSKVSIEYYCREYGRSVRPVSDPQ